MTHEEIEVIYQAVMLLQKLESRLGRDDEDFEEIVNLQVELLNIVEP